MIDKFWRDLAFGAITAAAVVIFIILLAVYISG
jgi:hypothetical protein